MWWSEKYIVLGVSMLYLIVCIACMWMTSGCTNFRFCWFCRTNKTMFLRNALKNRTGLTAMLLPHAASRKVLSKPRKIAIGLRQYSVKETIKSFIREATPVLTGGTNIQVPGFSDIVVIMLIVLFVVDCWLICLSFIAKLLYFCILIVSITCCQVYFSFIRLSAVVLWAYPLRFS